MKQLIRPNPPHVHLADKFILQTDLDTKIDISSNLFPTLHLAAASDPVAGAAATVIRRLQGSAELQQQRHHLAVAFLGRHQQRRQTSGGRAQVAGLVGSSRSAPGTWEIPWEF